MGMVLLMGVLKAPICAASVDRAMRAPGLVGSVVRSHAPGAEVLQLRSIRSYCA
jgi:hypothetical protein